MTERLIVGVYGSARLPESDPRWANAFSIGAALAEAGFTVATGGYEGHRRLLHRITIGERAAPSAGKATAAAGVH
jgi:predicted Rossmann-fold nucleotide-binding protein